MLPVYHSKKAMLKAYQKAKSFEQGSDEDYVQRSEFYFFFVCLYQYFEYFLIYKKVDNNFDDRIEF